MTKKELEVKLEQTEKALADYQFNYPSIKELEQENAALKNEIVNLKGVIESLSEQRDGLEKEKCELLGIIQGKDKAIADPCHLCAYIDKNGVGHSENVEVCKGCCWYHPSQFKERKK